MKSKLIALVVGMVIMIAPVWASAAYYTDRTAWEAAVAGYADVTLPQSDLAQWAKIDLPLGVDNFFNFNVPLTYVNISADDFYLTDTLDSSTGNYYANGTFYHSISSWQSETIPISAFGFEMQPAQSVNPVGVEIKLYTLDGGVLTQSYITLPYEDKFFGWVGYDVIGFSTWSVIPYYLYNFVEGVPASVPEPATMFLLGFGIIGFAGFRRKFKE